MTKPLAILPALALLLIVHPGVNAQQDKLVPAPDRRPGEGAGPFPTLTIRNVVVIDGTGAPPFGPANVILENNRIARIVNAGMPGVPSRDPAPPAAADMIDCTRVLVTVGLPTA